MTNSEQQHPKLEKKAPKKKRKFIKRLFIFFVILVFIVPLLGTLAYYFYFDTKVELYLTQRVQSELEKQLQREVSIGEIQLNFPNPQVVISNVAIARKDKLSEGTLLSAKTLKATILLESLLAEQILIDDIVLDSPKVWIEFDEQGHSNLPTFESKEEEPEQPARFDLKKIVERLTFPDIQLIDAQIYFAHQQLPLTVAVERLNTVASFALKGLHTRGKISLEGGEIEYQGQGKIATSISGDIEFQENSLTLSAFRINAGNTEIIVDGSVNDITNPQLNLAVLAKLALDEIDRYANIDQNLTGMVNFEGTVTGSVPDVAAQGQLDCQKGTAWKLAFENLSTELQYQEQKITLTDLKTDVFDGHLAGNVELSFSGTPGYAAAVTARNVQLEYVNALIDGQLDIAGIISGDIDVRADSFDFEDLVLQAAIELQQLQTYGVETARATADVGIRNQTLSIKGLDADLFQGNVQGHGSLVLHSDFQYQGEFEVQQIELGSIMPLIPEPPDVSGIMNGNVAVEGSEFDLEHAALKVDLNITGLDAYDVKAETLQTSARIADSSLFIDQLDVQLFGGNIRGNGRLTLAGDTLPLFETKLTLEDIAVATIIQQFAAQVQEQGIEISAGINGDVTLQGNSFALNGISGDVKLDGGGTLTVSPTESTHQEQQTRQLPLELTVDVSIRESLVNVASLQVDTPSLRLASAGTVNLSVPNDPELSLEYQVASEDIQTLMKQIIAFVPALGQDSPLDQFTGNIEQLQGTIQGSASQPDIQAEARFTNIDFVWIKAEEMSADVVYQGSSLHITHFEASLQSARVEAQKGTILLAGPSGVELDIPVTIHSGKVEDYLVMVKQELPITGSLKQISTTLRGPADNLQAKVVVGITQGIAWEQSFDALSGDLEMTDNRIVFHSITIQENKGKISVQGFFDFDLSFQAAITVTDLNFRDIDAGKDIAVQYQGKIDVTLKAEGTVENPKVNAAIRLKNLAYNKNSIEDVTCDVVLENQTLQATLITFRKKFVVTFQLSLKPDLVYEAKLLMQEAALEQILSLAGKIEGISGVITGEIHSAGSLKDLQKVTADVKLSTLDLDIFEQKIKNTKDIDLVITQQKLTIKSLEMKGDQLGVFAKGFLDFQGNYDLDFDGIFDLRPVLAFIPKSTGITSLAGRVQLICSVRGTFQEPIVEGLAEINQGRVQVATYPDPVTDITGKLAFSKGKIEIVRVAGKVSKGTFKTSGTINYTGITPGDFTINVVGKNLIIEDIIPEYAPLRLTVSPGITISGNVMQQSLSGEIFIHDALYSQDIDFLTMALTKSRTVALAPPETETETGLLLFDPYIRIKADNLKVDNKLAELTLKADLRIQGSAINPRLEGRLELLEGQVIFGGIHYEILSGVLDFLDPLKINPEMNIQVETEVQDYEVRLGIDGNLEQFSLNMTSEPPLSKGEITRLLAVGSDAGGASRLLINPVKSVVQEQIERYLKLDRLKVDVNPLLSGGNGTDTSPTVTLGKRLFKDLLVTYTTSVGGTERSQIVEIEYELPNNMSLTAKRNEKGEIDASFTFKFKLK